LKVVAAFCFSAMLAALSACSTLTERPSPRYQADLRQGLYGLRSWAFVGRLSLVAGQESWSAAVSWRHFPDRELIKLSGPLGQGAALIKLTEKRVEIDRGGGDVQSSNDPEVFIDQQLGMAVPLRSLAYWALGLIKPGYPSQQMPGGFLQDGWYVDFLELQTVQSWSMPRKMTVMNDKVKLKLIIDQWELDGISTTQ